MMFFSSMGPRWTPRHLLDQFWEGLGRIWGGFGEGLGRNFEGFGRFCVGFGQILDAFGKMWPCCGKAYKLDPRADPRSVTMRGGLRPPCVKRDLPSAHPLSLHGRGFAPLERGTRRPSHFWGTSSRVLLGGFWEHFGHFFSLCFALGHVLDASWALLGRFYAMFNDF